MNKETDTKLANFLQDIAPYVIVVGSFARKQEHELSDIDCYLRNRPVHEVDLELGNDTYMTEVLDIIEKHGFTDCCDSVIVGHIAVERTSGLSRMVEIASYYRIPHTSELFYREIEGVQMLCAADNKEADLEDCCDNPDWDDEEMDMTIKNPLPSYNPPINAWYNAHVKQKPDKVVVKLKNADGSFKESCITPTVMYPLNGKPEVFTYNNTCRITDKELLKIFDSVKYNVGKCYQNTIDLVAALKESGYDAKSYVGWLYVSEHSYPIHHCWAVINNSVLDLSDDYTIMFHGQNGKYFEDCKTVEEQRELMAEFREAAAKQPNSIRCAPVGRPSSFLLYIGCECDPNEGRKIYRKLIEDYPNHPVHSNVDRNGLNATQRLFKEKGLM